MGSVRQRDARRILPPSNQAPSPTDAPRPSASRPRHSIHVAACSNASRATCMDGDEIDLGKGKCKRYDCLSLARPERLDGWKTDSKGDSAS